MSFGNKVASSTGFSLSNVTRNVFCSLYTMEQNIIWCRIWTPRLTRFHLVQSPDTINMYYEFPIMVFVPFTGIYCTSRDRELNADKLWCTTALIYFNNAQFAIRPIDAKLLSEIHNATWPHCGLLMLPVFFCFPFQQAAIKQKNQKWLNRDDQKVMTKFLKNESCSNEWERTHVLKMHWMIQQIVINC